MFEVDWTDYDRELVGERKARKELQKDRKKKEDTHSGRASVSTRSSSSSNEKPLGFFGSIGLKKRPYSSKARKPIPSAFFHSTKDGIKVEDGLDLIPEIPSNPSTSAERLSIEADTRSTSQTPTALTLNPPLDGFQAPWEDLQETPVRDSKFSKSTGATSSPPTSSFGGSVANSTCSRTKTIQVLSSDSYITQTTDISYEKRKSDGKSDAATAEVMITADRAVPQTPTPPLSPKVSSLVIGTVDKELSSIHPLHRPILRPGETYLIGREVPAPLISPAGLSPRPPLLSSSLRQSATHWVTESRLKSASGPQSTCPVSFEIDNPDAWRPPEAWECNATDDAQACTTSKLRQAAAAEEAAYNSMSMDLPTLQRELRRMAAASPQIKLARLTEEWESTPDASFYKELEMEKKRWMLSALYNMDREEQGNSLEPEDSESGSRILALFETKATASYLAALHMNSRIIHLATSTLSNNFFPNVQPLLSPIASNAALSVAPNSFTAVYCLSLSSVVPSPEIPRLLKNIYRCLAPRGALHLVVIDPVPVASTAGPLMRTWLENNLILNLEKNFRCVSPSKLFPTWLSDNRLRGSGSSITKLRFRAVPSQLASGDNGGTAPAAESGERRIKTELRSIVGRMLWQEVWGQYVNAEKWWWEEPTCIQECIDSGTYWEYTLIEAVKDSG